MGETGSGNDLRCDVAVIGAGTAGISAERAARKAGAKTLLIDPYFAGTVCASVGCMPSKLLIAAAHAAHDLRRAEVFGIEVPPARIDGGKVMQRVRDLRDDFVAGVKRGFDRLPPGTCIRASARFDGPKSLRLDDGRRIEAGAIVITTGAFPLVPGPFTGLGDRLLTNRTVFDLPDLPDRLAVIGAGPIGLELAQAFGRLGVSVTLFDQGRRLGRIRCDRVHRVLRDSLSRDVDLKLGCKVIPEARDEAIHLRWSGDHDGEADFDHVLLATGRPPALAGLDLDRAGLALDDDGVPVFDRNTMQCGDGPVFIAGDVNADVAILHEAAAEGGIAGSNAAAFPSVGPVRRNHGFMLIFTDPPTATIGAGPDQAGLSGLSDYADQGRARVEARAEGVVRINADVRGKLIGADLCASGGEHLAHLLAWAIEAGNPAQALLGNPFYHPTLEEGMRPALRQICKAARIDVPFSRDPGDPPGR
tara:strand:+ start:17037 stop:18461 length:1425 start_codon:yes stop_codon:yes gene_type:complete